MKFWSTPQAMQSMPEITKVMNETPKLVASRAPFEPGWNKVTVISGDVVEQIRKLKEQPGKGIIIFGSNQLVVDLMQAGLMDEFQIVVNPVVFGDGTPLFKGLQKKASPKLTNSRTFKSGCVLLTYQPA
jgi:dihydrofolate reductase